MIEKLVSFVQCSGIGNNARFNFDKFVSDISKLAHLYRHTGVHHPDKLYDLFANDLFLEAFRLI